MIQQESLLVTLVRLVDRLPEPPLPKLFGGDRGGPGPIPTGSSSRRWSS